MSSRVIWSDNGVLKDISVSLGDFTAETNVIPFVAAEDKLYIGSDFPFNHRYIDMVAVNDVASTISIDLWNGQEWKPAFDIQDRTSIAGVTLAQSGIVSWVKDTRESWSAWDTNNEGEQITGLTGVKILKLYWARISFSVSLKATTELQYIGHKFSDDNALDIKYPDLGRTAVKAQFKAAKSDWKLQHIQAAEEIIKDLKNRSIIKSKNQILDWELFKGAAVHKVASMAFNAFGKDFKPNEDAAEDKYKIEMNQAVYNIDLNNNATLDPIERRFRQGNMYR